MSYQTLQLRSSIYGTTSRQFKYSNIYSKFLNSITTLGKTAILNWEGDLATGQTSQRDKKRPDTSIDLAPQQTRNQLDKQRKTIITIDRLQKNYQITRPKITKYSETTEN